MPGPDASAAAHAATLSFEYPAPSRAAVVERAVRREVGEIDGDRSRASVTRDGATVRVEVAATDLVGLRAGLNTWLGLVGTAEDVAEAAAATRGADGRGDCGD